MIEDFCIDNWDQTPIKKIIICEICDYNDDTTKSRKRFDNRNFCDSCTQDMLDLKKAELFKYFQKGGK